MRNISVEIFWKDSSICRTNEIEKRDAKTEATEKALLKKRRKKDAHYFQIKAPRIGTEFQRTKNYIT